MRERWDTGGDVDGGEWEARGARKKLDVMDLQGVARGCQVGARAWRGGAYAALMQTHRSKSRFMVG